MTLFETVVAFVLLSVVGIACLDLSRGATSLETRSVEWSNAVAVGDAVMTAAAAGANDDELSASAAYQRDVRIQRVPWRDGADGIDVMDVQVMLPSGARYHATRLVRTRRALPAR